MVWFFNIGWSFYYSAANMNILWEVWLSWINFYHLITTKDIQICTVSIITITWARFKFYSFKMILGILSLSQYTQFLLYICHYIYFVIFFIGVGVIIITWRFDLFLLFFILCLCFDFICLWIAIILNTRRNFVRYFDKLFVNLFVYF